jgi:hypothetical protein
MGGWSMQRSETMTKRRRRSFPPEFKAEVVDAKPGLTCAPGQLAMTPSEGRRNGTEAVRKQYHFWPAENGVDAWDIDRLLELTRDLPVEQVELTDVFEIDSVYWFDEWQRPTVRRVVEHVRLVQEVDPSHPIILGPDGRVMDGMHRVARALLEGRTTIAARRLPVLPEPDYRNCRPDELPY